MYDGDNNCVEQAFWRLFGWCHDRIDMGKLPVIIQARDQYGDTSVHTMALPFEIDPRYMPREQYVRCLVSGLDVARENAVEVHGLEVN